MSDLKPKILFYDIETVPLKAWVWRLGEQVIRHDQLDKNFAAYNIMTIQYCWNDGKPAKVLTWDYETQDSKQMIKDFDEIIKQADVIIGKNNARFDDKHINTQRFLHGLDGMPDWVAQSDDLERQMRKYFAFPSMSLDYVSKQLGLGGKIKMEMKDWIDIIEKNPNGKKAFDKMIKYGGKDVEDTRTLWNMMSKHFKPKFNHSAFTQDFCCVVCGSKNIQKNGTRATGKVLYQRYHCNDHGGSAGKQPVNAKTIILGS